jgi:hypothetical protein
MASQVEEVILAATSIGLLVAAIWAAAIGQSAVACVFGIFAGFWLSYVILVIGLIHGWFGILPIRRAGVRRDRGVPVRQLAVAGHRRQGAPARPAGPALTAATPRPRGRSPR